MKKYLLPEMKRKLATTQLTAIECRVESNYRRRERTKVIGRDDDDFDLMVGGVIRYQLDTCDGDAEPMA